MTITVDAPPLQTDSTGTVRVGDSRVSLDLIVYAYLNGERPEEIATAYPSVTLDQVYASIAYYLRHRDEVDAYLAQREREADQIRADWEARFPSTGPSKSELLERWQRQFGAPFPNRRGA